MEGRGQEEKQEEEDEKAEEEKECKVFVEVKVQESDVYAVRSPMFGWLRIFITLTSLKS